MTDQPVTLADVDTFARNQATAALAAGRSQRPWLDLLALIERVPAPSPEATTTAPDREQTTLADALERELVDYVELAEDGWARQAARACVDAVRLCGWNPPSARGSVTPAEEEPEGCR